MEQDAFIRTIVLAFSLLNQLLVSFDLTPVPGTQESWYKIVSTIVTVVAAAIAWWKNNSVTFEARKADRYLKELKRKKEHS